MLSLGALNNTLVMSPPNVQAGITDISGSFPGTESPAPIAVSSGDGTITEISGTFPEQGSPGLFQLPPVYQPSNAVPPPISTVPSTFQQPSGTTTAQVDYTPILFAGLGVIVVALIVTMPKGRRR